MNVGAPASAPCGSCPYRRDVPSGVWSEEEYAKLPPYDNDTADQPMSVFMCHRQDGRVCAGWAGCHDMQESFGLRMAVYSGQVDEATYDAIVDYVSAVPLFGSGAEAAVHGLRDVDAPSTSARRIIDKLEGRRSA